MHVWELRDDFVLLFFAMGSIVNLRRKYSDRVEPPVCYPSHYEDIDFEPTQSEHDIFFN